MKLDFNKVRMFEFKSTTDLDELLNFLRKHNEFWDRDTYLCAYEEFHYYKIKISQDESITLPTRKIKLLCYDFNHTIVAGDRINEI